MKKFDKYRNWIVAFVFAVAVIAVYKTFDNFYKVAEIIGVFVKSLSPFVIGFVIAYILNIPATKIERLCQKSKYALIKKRSKGISIVGVYLITALLFYIAISAIAPALYRNFVDLYFNIPGYINEALATIENLQQQYGFTLFEINEANILNAFNTFLGKIDIAEFGKYAKGVVNITSGVINVLIGIIVSVYMLIEKEKIKAALKRMARVLLKEEKAGKLIENVRKINNVFSKYLFC
ncbi:MAG: AI-2E family transporter, partial [Clostridia bacterium]|nr:AI-2E family transporter [Clostridia bacterium]